MLVLRIIGCCGNWPRIIGQFGLFPSFLSLGTRFIREVRNGRSLAGLARASVAGSSTSAEGFSRLTEHESDFCTSAYEVALPSTCGYRRTEESGSSTWLAKVSIAWQLRSKVCHAIATSA